MTHSQIIRRLSRPLKPHPVDQTTRLRRLFGIRAILFDVYGTLLISGSGEVGTARQTARADALAEALGAAGFMPRGPDGAAPGNPDGSVAPRVGGETCDKQSVLAAALEYSFDLIEEQHTASRSRGNAYPEIDILDIWDAVLDRLRREGAIVDRPWDRRDLERLAVQYEARTNPVWPMPGLEACLAGFAAGGLLMGIVSNAQFYTRELFPALLGHSAESLGIAPDLQIYSYEHGMAKPGHCLHRLAAERLAAHNIEPAEALYVGNDMLNDIAPARRVGFRTALFAGDARSLRLRRGDPQVEGLEPDLIVTRLLDLNGCILDGRS